MPISAVDTISPAFQHTKQQLLQPFRISQWTRLALVGLFAGELNSGGCNFNYQMPTRTGADRFVDVVPAVANPALYAGLIALLIVAGLVLFVLLIYANSVMRFVLFDSVVEKHCAIRRNWSRRQKPGLRYFVWQILLLLAMMVGLTILVGIPAAFGLAVGWLREPKQHLVPLILGGMLLFFLLLAYFIFWLVVQVLTKDFVVPQMALENLTAMEGWRRLWPMVKSEKGGYAGYLGMKIVMTIGAAIVVGVVAGVVILVMLIPVGGVGALLVLAGKAGGLNWNLYTITLAVVVGTIVVGLIVYVIALISVPTIVFFPAYSIYFFAARYPTLDAIIHPAPPAPPAPPPMPVSLPPPEPIG